MIKKAYHPSGLSVTFDEGPHTYKVDRTGQVLTSGTTFIDRFFPKFESEKVARKCAGRKKYAGMTVEQVLKQWGDESRRGREEGTNTHLYCEYLSAGKFPLPEPQSVREVRLFLQAASAILSLEEKPLVFVEAEKIIFSPDFGLAGTVDLLLWDPRSEEIVILDWKQNKKIKTANGFENALAPIEHMDSCDWSKYQLQLNLYEWILKREGYYPKAKGFRKAVIHLREDRFVGMKVGGLHSEIDRMITYAKTITTESG